MLLLYVSFTVKIRTISAINYPSPARRLLVSSPDPEGGGEMGSAVWPVTKRQIPVVFVEAWVEQT